VPNKRLHLTPRLGHRGRDRVCYRFWLLAITHSFRGAGEPPSVRRAMQLHSPREMFVNESTQRARSLESTGVRGDMRINQRFDNPRCFFCPPTSRWALYFFLPALLSINPQSVFAQTHDVFPLKEGIQYEYDLSYSFYSVDQYLPSLYAETGSIRYVVLGFTLINDTALWDIERERNLIIQSTGRGPGLGDTTYAKVDTNYFVLRESLLGSHSLSLNPGTDYIWGGFPALAGNAGSAVSRYSDSTFATTVVMYNGWFGGYDSIQQRENMGLYHRFTGQSHSGAGNSVSMSMTATLRLLSPVTELHGQLSQRCTLCQNYPNPFNPTTTINYLLPIESHVSIEIFDALGRRITCLVDQIQTAGRKSVRWNPSDLPSGVYFCRMTAGGFADSKRMLLVR
jgi:hypothetical protein